MAQIKKGERAELMLLGKKHYGINWHGHPFWKKMINDEEYRWNELRKIRDTGVAPMIKPRSAGDGQP